MYSSYVRTFFPKIEKNQPIWQDAYLCAGGSEINSLVKEMLDDKSVRKNAALREQLNRISSLLAVVQV